MQTGNLLLDSLARDDFASLASHLKQVHLSHKTILVEAGNETKAIYFPITAIVSLVVGLSSGTQIEAAMVWRDGLVGASAALDGRISLSRAVVQLEGQSLVCDVGALRHAAYNRQSLMSKLIRHEQTLFA